MQVGKGTWARLDESCDDLSPNVHNIIVKKVRLRGIQKALLLKQDWVVHCHCHCHILLVGWKDSMGQVWTPVLRPQRRGIMGLRSRPCGLGQCQR